MKQRRGPDRNAPRPTPGDPRGAEQHHRNTGAKENQQPNPDQWTRRRCDNEKKFTDGPMDRRTDWTPDSPLWDKLYLSAELKCEWRKTVMSLKEKYNTNCWYYKTYFYVIFRACKSVSDGQKRIFGKFYSGWGPILGWHNGGGGGNTVKN